MFMPDEKTFIDESVIVFVTSGGETVKEILSVCLFIYSHKTDTTLNQMT